MAPEVVMADQVPGTVDQVLQEPDLTATLHRGLLQGLPTRPLAEAQDQVVAAAAILHLDLLHEVVAQDQVEAHQEEALRARKTKE